MQLQHKFELPATAQRTWELLNRIEEITPCLPGASAKKLTEDRYDILMKIRFGPLDLAFKGAIDIVERDLSAFRMVVKTKAKDSKGQGSANGATTVTMFEESGTTKVVLDTELMIGGRIAQMGRGMVADVSNELLARFVENLRTRFLADNQEVVAATVIAESDPIVTSGAGSRPTEQSVDGLTQQPAKPASQSKPGPEEYVDVGAAVRRAMWRRIVNLLFFWRKPT